ncbi:hypothetical protein GCM10010222_11610 [Streptomyces tanashiensis]|nr:hypothetical protein GCM10010222_11610 [Streptomyces tanashiensis]
MEARTQSTPALTTHLALIRPYLPAHVDELSFTVHQKDEVHTLAGPLAPWHEVATAPQDSEAKMMAYFRAQLSWTYNNAPVLSTHHVRRWTALQAAQTMHQAPAEPSPACAASVIWQSSQAMMSSPGRSPESSGTSASGRRQPRQQQNFLGCVPGAAFRPYFPSGSEPENTEHRHSPPPAPPPRGRVPHHTGLVAA